ncbi:hypothetical protein HDU78_007558, partial [Chytriomyces hyalinus]
TNILFDIAAKSTITRHGACTVNICKPKTKGGSSATACLTVGMNGIKLPSFIVVKGTRLGKQKNAPVITEARNSLSQLDSSTALFTAQNNAWCDEDVMLEWIDCVREPYTVSKGKQPMLLMLELTSICLPYNSSVHSSWRNLKGPSLGYGAIGQREIADMMITSWKNIQASTIIKTFHKIGFYCSTTTLDALLEAMDSNRENGIEQIEEIEEEDE